MIGDFPHQFVIRNKGSNIEILIEDLNLFLISDDFSLKTKLVNLNGKLKLTMRDVALKLTAKLDKTYKVLDCKCELIIGEHIEVELLNIDDNLFKKALTLAQQYIKRYAKAIVGKAKLEFELFRDRND